MYNIYHKLLEEYKDIKMHFLPGLQVFCYVFYQTRHFLIIFVCRYIKSITLINKIHMHNNDDT